MTPSDPLSDAIAVCGTAAELARRLGISAQAITQWQRRKRVPANRVIAVETATDARITRHQLRPDLYPEEKTRRRA